MAYDAKVLSVMIASPGDVNEERNLIRDIIHEWNDINSRQTGRVLLPVGWETHAAASMGARPQELINKAVLEHCDLLVGVFWTRIGTPTGEAISGTVEEIQRHLDAGKPAMIYFSTAPVAPQSLDPDQYAELRKFREWCNEKGLTETYENLSQFSDRFRRHIQITVRDDDYLKKFSAKTGEPEARVAASDPERVGVVLSEEARRLLVEASRDKDGTIWSLRFLSGQAIQTNGINFADSKDRRSIARWESAIEQLLRNDLIAARGRKGEIFFVVTAQGYDLAERLIPENPD